MVTITNLSSDDWTEWKRKRKSTFAGFVITNLIIGMDYSLTITILFLYLKDMIKVDKPEMYYGIIAAIFDTQSAIFAVISGRWVDKYRKVSLYTNIIIILKIVGGLIFVVPTSVAYPLVARLISGIGDSYRSVITGEVVRIYSGDEATSALFWLEAWYGFGFVIGPVVVIVFRNVDFYFIGLHLTQLNSGEILIAGIFIVVLIITNFLIHDCSAKFDLKAYLNENITSVAEGNMTENILNEEISTNDNNIRETSASDNNENNTKKSAMNTEYVSQSLIIDEKLVNQSVSAQKDVINSKSTHNTLPISVILLALLTHGDTLLVFIASFVFTYCLQATDVVLPMINTLVLDWTVEALSLIFIANGVLYLPIIILCSKFCTSDRKLYFMFLYAIISCVLAFVDIILLTHLKINLVLDIMLVVALVLFWVGEWIGEIVVRCTLAKMVPSHCQSFVEALRHGLSKLSMITASLTTPLLLPFVRWWCIAVIIINLVLLVVIIWRRSNLVEVKKITFKHDGYAMLE